MKSSVKDIELIKYDDLFKDENTKQEEKLERILIVPADQVFPYARQPYSVDRPTPDLVRLMDSIERMGISEPLITRLREGGGYEIISGHRRDYCGKVIGLAERPIIVRQYTDEDADILVADYNITRENLLPSEKARAYKLKLDAMKRQAGRPSKENGDRNGPNLIRGRSKEILATQVGESATQVQRYVCLNNLIPSLLERVDKSILKLIPAADYISHLTEKEQTYLAYVMERDETSPSVKQAQRLKQFSEQGKLQEGAIDAIMSEEKPFEVKVVFKQDRLKKYFPQSYTPQQMEDVIIKLLDRWHRKRQQEQSR